MYRIVITQGILWERRWEIQRLINGNWKGIIAFQDKEKCIAEFERIKITL